MYESLLEVTSPPSSPGGKGQGQERDTQQQPGEKSDTIQKKKRKKLNLQEREWYPKRKRMHPRNIYSIEKPDFMELSRLYPSLKPFLKMTTVQTSTAAASSDEKSRRMSINFEDDDACRELVRVQLHHDFGIEWSLDAPYLVPPLANRLNYICWLDDVLSLWNRCHTKRRCILDIGCGANLIYPLLVASYVGWRCFGCDVNGDALQVAARNRDANPDLAPLIHLRHVPMQPCQTPAAAADDDDEKNPKGIISSCIRDDDGEFDACMCNPPFFSKEEDAGKNPKTAFGGMSMEMVYPGGEEAFIKNMIRDSAKHTTACTWFSSMVGKKSTMKMARKMIHDLGRTVVRTTEFVQGKTSRWAIAWSFVAPQDVALKPLSRTI